MDRLSYDRLCDPLGLRRVPAWVVGTTWLAGASEQHSINQPLHLPACGRTVRVIERTHRMRRLSALRWDRRIPFPRRELAPIPSCSSSHLTLYGRVSPCAGYFGSPVSSSPSLFMAWLLVLARCARFASRLETRRFSAAGCRRSLRRACVCIKAHDRLGRVGREKTRTL